MELPHLGKQCFVSTCNMLDFLPVKCDACSNIFCKNHMTYELHNCQLGKMKDRQVPICPLCGCPVPCPRNEPPDYAVGAHIDRDCQSDPAKAKRKVNANKCSMPGCKVKEMVPILCADCKQNFCLKHRFTGDHNCLKAKHLPGNVFRGRDQGRNGRFSDVQGSMSEDEALARALEASMNESRLRPQPAAVPTGSQRCQVS